MPTITTTLGYTYSIRDSVAIGIYAVAVALLGLNLVSDKVPVGVGKRLHFLGIIMLLACLFVAVNTSKDGMDWFTRQYAHDAPAMRQANQEAYWAELGRHRPLAGVWLGLGVLLMGGRTSLRDLYDDYGPNVEINDQAVFQNAINQLTQQEAQELVMAAGIDIEIVPYGVLTYSASLIFQIAMLVMVSRRVKDRKYEA